MKTLICEICGKEFEAAHSRSWGDRCKTCANWLWAFGKGPFQKGDEDYKKLGMVIAYLVKKGELKKEDFIHGLIEGIRKT